MRVTRGNTMPYHLNIRRRTVDPATGTAITLSAWPDGNDPALMPVAQTIFSRGQW